MLAAEKFAGMSNRRCLMVRARVRHGAICVTLGVA